MGNKRRNGPGGQVPLNEGKNRMVRFDLLAIEAAREADAANAGAEPEENAAYTALWNEAVELIARGYASAEGLERRTGWACFHGIETEALAFRVGLTPAARNDASARARRLGVRWDMKRTETGVNA